MANNDDNYNPPENEAYASMDDGGGSDGPSVAAPKGKNFVIIGLGILIIGLLLYLFLGGKGSSKKEDEDEDAVITTTTRNAPTSISRPVFNEDIIAPPPPPPPAVPEEIVQPVEDEAAEVSISPLQDPKKKKRYQSNMLITSGVFNSSNLSSGSATSKANQKDIYSAANDNDPNVGFADNYYNQDSVPNAYARKLGNTARLITQGKILEAILETPINTDVPGMIRGIISHDIYGESARTILIPKGSRVVGTYNNLVVRGNKRVNIIWTRVIRPDGIDVMIRSPGTDQLGTAGVEGIVDNKYLEVFSSAFLVSAINIAVATGVDAMDDEENTTTTNTDGSTTKTVSAKNQAALEAVDLFGSAGRNLIDGALNTNPTITIEQGTRVSIFVNRDLVFPSELINQVQIIQ